MSFNLKDFLTKKAGKGLDQTTEAQLGNDGKGPNTLQENQLSGMRGKEPGVVTDKQLETTRTKEAPGEVTEAQLGSRKGPVPAAVSEKQLDGDRSAHSEEAVEKRLQKVRTSADVSVTEGQFGKRDGKEAKKTEVQLEQGRVDRTVAMIEKHLEKARKGEQQKLTEAQMDDSKSKLVKHRNPDAAMGDINKLEEQRLAGEKAEAQKYKPASETDPKKMLPQTKGKDGLKTAQVFVSASQHEMVTPRFRMGQAVKISPEALADMDPSWGRKIKAGVPIRFNGVFDGDCVVMIGGTKIAMWQDDLSADDAVANGTETTAAVVDKMTKTAQVEYDIGFLERGPSDNPLDSSGDWPLAESDPYKNRRPRIEDMAGASAADDGLGHGKRKRQMLRDLTHGVDKATEDELAAIDENPDDDVLPEEEGDPDAGAAAKLPDDFTEVSVNDVDVGMSKMRQIVLSFDPSEFKDESDVKNEASLWLLSHYPTLFSYKAKGKKENIGIKDSVTLSMEEGKAIAMFPADAFKSQGAKAA